MTYTSPNLICTARCTRTRGPRGGCYRTTPPRTSSMLIGSNLANEMLTMRGIGITANGTAPNSSSTRRSSPEAFRALSSGPCRAGGPQFFALHRPIPSQLFQQTHYLVADRHCNRNDGQTKEVTSERSRAEAHGGENGDFPRPERRQRPRAPEVQQALARRQVYARQDQEIGA